MLANLGWVAAVVGPVAAALLFVPRALWKRWRERVVDRLDHGLRRGTTRFGRHYREYTLASLKYIDLKGLAVVGFHTPEFEDVFVDVGLAYQTPHNAPAGLLARLSADDRHAVTDFLDQPDPVVLAVIGVPGSGKTTLLRHLASTISQARRGRRRVPILLYLRDHVADIVAGAPLPALVRAGLGRYGPQEPPGWFEKRLRDGDCVVLLDGLDEVADQEDRRKVSDWVERQTREYPRNDYVLTSRPHGYRSAPVNGAVVLQVRDFTDDQVSRFVRGWYAAIEKLSTQGTGEAVRLRADKAADELLDKLHANSALYDLTVNPLLLTMVANVHRFGSKLPDSRAELYREICEVMLWRRHEAKNLPVRLDGHRKEVVLRSLAYMMMSGKVRDASRAGVLAEFKPILRRMSTTMTAEALLEDVSSNGLLVERENGVFSFAHLTFQEYLAAEHIRESGGLEFFAARVDDDWWRETIVLGVARAVADEIVRACLDRGTVATLSLALDCAEVCSELSPELRAELDRAADVLSDDPERRRLIAGVLLTRHAREQIAVDGAAVCPRPVTNALYGLYLRDRGWPIPPDVDPAKPVRGVWESNATDFSRWANMIAGGPRRYRLPKDDEVDQPLVRRALTNSGHRFWLDSGKSHPPTVVRSIPAKTLAEHVRSDVVDNQPLLCGLVLTYIAGVHELAIRDLAVVDWPTPGPDVERVIRRTEDLLRDAFRLVSDLGLELAFSGLRRPDLRPDHIVVGLATIRESALNVVVLPADEIALFRTALADSLRGSAVARLLGLDRASRPDLPAGVDEHTLAERVLGRAMGLGLAAMVNTRRGSTRATVRVRWEAGLGTALIEAANLGEARWEVDPVKLRQDVVATPDGLGAVLWDPGLPDRIREVALPIVTGQEPITAELATAVRLGALSVAGELDRRSEEAQRYLRIAAGITLLERRADGREPAEETILLATDRRNG